MLGNVMLALQLLLLLLLPAAAPSCLADACAAICGSTTPDAAFPLRYFNDKDIWEYTEKFDVPQQWDRYDRTTKKENPDKETNSDYANVCISCIDIKKKGQFVKCPKLNNLVVSNISESVCYDKPKFGYFGNQNA
jgi:hypothetical protein